MPLPSLRKHTVLHSVRLQSARYSLDHSAHACASISWASSCCPTAHWVVLRARTSRLMMMDGPAAWICLCFHCTTCAVPQLLSPFQQSILCALNQLMSQHIKERTFATFFHKLVRIVCAPRHLVACRTRECPPPPAHQQAPGAYVHSSAHVQSSVLCSYRLYFQP